MNLTKHQMKALENLFGPERAAEIVARLEAEQEAKKTGLKVKFKAAPPALAPVYDPLFPGQFAPLPPYVRTTDND